MIEENLPYHLKYRPLRFGELVGQDSIVKSLKGLFESKQSVPHSFLFSGSSGTGKTTIARIIAKEIGCLKQNIVEVDAATNTGVDNIRTLQDSLRYGAIGKNNIKFIILDEAHQFSKSAWNSLLKIIEEPPKHVFFVFCTTELNKVPKTIQTRCHHYALKDVSIDDLFDLLEFVCDVEKLVLDDKSLNLIAKEAQGSPRQALVCLSKVRNCSDSKETALVLETLESEGEVIDICRLLVKKASWKQVITKYKILSEINPESIRMAIFGYFTSCLLGARTDEDAIVFLDTMSIFSNSLYNPSTAKGDLLLMLGDCVFQD